MHIEQELIVVLGGALKKTRGGWRTTTFSEGDNFGISGDRYCVVAASYLYKNNPRLFFLASGGKGQYIKIAGVPAVAEVLKKELIQLRIPAGQICVEKRSINTLEQLLMLQGIIEKNNKLKKVFIIANRHHVPRIKTFIKYFPGLSRIKKRFEFGDLKLLAAESVLLKADQGKWKKIIEKAYASQAMKKRLLIERRGISQIKDGSYNFRIHGKNYE